MYKLNFDKCPSATQIRSHVNKARAAGHSFIQITWGENEITLEKGSFNGFFGPWFGYGWIKRIGGDDLARAINQEGK
jgi:hypothetical protein